MNIGIVAIVFDGASNWRLLRNCTPHAAEVPLFFGITTLCFLPQYLGAARAAGERAVKYNSNQLN